jgi:hypothetical protein
MPESTIPNPHTETAEWVAFKRRKIGGHAAVTLSGASYSPTGQKSYQTLQELYDLLVHGIVDPITEEKERFFAWRLGLEQNIADRYAIETGRKIRKCGSGLHPDNEMLMYSPDREILKHERGLGLLELKSRDPMAWQAIKLNGVAGATWVQEQFYQMCKGVKWGAICEANVSSGELLHFDIDSDLEFHRVLYQRITAFLEDCRNGKRPAAEIADPVRLPAVGGELVTIEQMNTKLVGEFKGIAAGAIEARNLRDRAKDHYEMTKKATGEWMKLNGFDVVEGFGARIYNKEQKGKAGFDRKSLARDNPDLDLTEYETRGNPFRRFVVYDRPVAITSENGE